MRNVGSLPVVDVMMIRMMHKIVALRAVQRLNLANYTKTLVYWTVRSGLDRTAIKIRWQVNVEMAGMRSTRHKLSPMDFPTKIVDCD